MNTYEVKKRYYSTGWDLTYTIYKWEDRYSFTLNYSDVYISDKEELEYEENWYQEEFKNQIMNINFLTEEEKDEIIENYAPLPICNYVNYEI